MVCRQYLVHLDAPPMIGWTIARECTTSQVHYKRMEGNGNSVHCTNSQHNLPTKSEQQSPAVHSIRLSLTRASKVCYLYIICHRPVNFFNSFYIYITIDNTFCIFFLNFQSSSIFVVIVLVQLCVILVRKQYVLLKKYQFWLPFFTM